MTPEDLEQIAAVLNVAERRIVDATVASVDRIVDATTALVDATAASLRAEIKAAEERTNARIEHVETTLLTEFHKGASPMEMRARTHAAVLRAIDAVL